MKIPWLDALLVLVILLGGVWLFRASLARQAAGAEVERLERVTGRIKIADPAKVYIRGIPSDDPLSFAWHVYIPKNYRIVVRDESGGSSWGSSSEPTQFIARVKLRENDSGVQVYRTTHGSSSLGGIQHELAKFLRGRWHELKVEQFARDSLEELDPQTGEALLLRLSLPPELEREAREKIPAHRLPAMFPSVMKLHFGPPTGNP